MIGSRGRILLLFQERDSAIVAIRFDLRRYSLKRMPLNKVPYPLGVELIGLNTLLPYAFIVRILLDRQGYSTST